MKIVDKRTSDRDYAVREIVIYPHVASTDTIPAWAGTVEARAVRDFEDGGKWKLEIRTNVSGGKYELEIMDEFIVALLYARKLATLDILMQPDVPLPEPDGYHVEVDVK